jgi:hypothetical protein
LPGTPRRGAGGCDFLADPSLRADQAAVIWHPDEHDQVVLLTTARAASSGLRFAPGNWPANILRRDAADGCHLVVGDRTVRFQLWFPAAPSDGGVMTALLPADGTAAARAEATLRFWRYVRDGRAEPVPARQPRSNRRVMMLRALDGHLDGAAYREIAEALFGAGRVADGPWKTSPWRDRIIRLVRQGQAMAKGGYRHLLRRDRDG